MKPLISRHKLLALIKNNNVTILDVRDKEEFLPSETKIYPAHDYKGILSSTVELEKKFNPRLGGNKSKDEFVQIMKEQLAEPKKIHEAIPANLACGQVIERNG